MGSELTTISPEGIEIANSYLVFGNIDGVCSHLGVSRHAVTEVLNTREVKKYIDTVYMDTGYRNRTNIASLLDEMIRSKLEEAEESGIYTSKDLFDLVKEAHKMRIDEQKLEIEREKSSTNIRKQTNVQINDSNGAFGEGNYAKLMKKLIGEDS